MVLPVPTAPSTAITELEQIMSLGWRGHTVRALGDWLLRTGSGFTGRANSVFAVGDPGAPLDQALSEIAAFYASFGQPPIFQVPTGLPELAQLDQELTRRGWGPAYNHTLVMTAPLSVMLAHCPPSATLPPAELEPAPSAQWLTGYLYRGNPLPDSAIQVLVSADRPVFAAIRDEHGQAGVARGVVDADWLGVTAVTVDPARRRAGIGRQLMGELGRWALDRGARNVYLQVDRDNAVAVGMYVALGFSVHHSYHYRRLDSVGPG